MMERRRSTGGGHGTGDGRGGFAAVPRGADRQLSPSNDPVVPTVERGARTIDALFGPLPVSESTGRVWLYEGGQIRPVDVRLGITDGTTTELLGVRPSRRGSAPAAAAAPPAGHPSAAAAPGTPAGHPAGGTPDIDDDGGRLLEVGVELVTNVTTGPEQERPASGIGRSPFMPFPPRFGPGGGGGGRGPRN
jgi:hypothetical protein